MFKTVKPFGLLFLLIGLLSLNPVYASKSQTVDEILLAAGINKLIDASPRLAIAALKQSAFAVDQPKVNSELQRAYNQAFTTQSIHKDINQALSTAMDQKLADSYLWQLADPNWQRFSKLERASSDPDNAEEMSAFSTSLKETPPSDARQALIERLDAANRTSEFSVNLKLAFFRSVFSAINPVMEVDMKIEQDELKTMQDEVRKSIEADITNHVHHSYLYAFRDLSDQELEQYIALSESEINRNSNQLLTSAIISAIDKASQRAAAIMRKSDYATQ